ncbi:hypothetical protein ACJMK2_013911 [Sinanodonta woodiana]|uniref:D-serine dehydratase n=1 Tax=Sinanodonta woodiana TaxID=1069815 RepID=A0ABD3V084_SINWO
MADELPETIYDVPTPSFLVDLDIVKRNCSIMIEQCKQYGVELRPHMKTHKTIEGGILMTGGTKKKIVVSTLAEAEFYADNGFDDILYGFPIIKEKLDRCAKLVNRLDMFHLMFDNLTSLEAIKSSTLDLGKKWSVFLELDCGNGRSGVKWNSDDAVHLAKMASTAENIIFQGLYTHCGDSYTSYARNEGLRREIQENTTERLLFLKDRLQKEGIHCKSCGCGSTPSCTNPIDSMSGLTEFHPGNYIFYDFMQMTIGTVQEEDVAVKVATRVVSHRQDMNMMIVDAGFSAISYDGIQRMSYQPTGISLFKGHPNLRLFGMTQEHGKVQPIEGALDFDKYPYGKLLFLIPWHSCDTAMMHPLYYVHSGDMIVDIWRPCRGW